MSDEEKPINTAWGGSAWGKPEPKRIITPRERPLIVQYLLADGALVREVLNV